MYYGKALTVVPANISKNTPDDGFYYEINSLMKLLQVIEGRIKLEIDAKGFMLIKTRNEVYLQLPRRVPVKKAKNAENVDKAA